MKKVFRLLLIVCFFTQVFSGGCKDKRQEPVNSGKPSTAKTEKLEQKTISQPKLNSPPKILEAAISPDPAYANSDLRVEVKADDPEGDLINLQYQWISFKYSGGPVRRAEDIKGETNPTLSHDKFVHGDVVAVRITPFDWNGAEGEMYQTRFRLIKNSPPEIISLPPKNLPQSKVYTYQVKVKDPDNDPINFSLSEGAPQGMTIDSTTGLITWPIPPGTSGTFTARVNGDDGYGGNCYQRFSLTLTGLTKSEVEKKE